MKIGFIETIKRVGKNLGATKEEKFRVLAKKTTIPNRRLKDDSSTHKRMPPIEQFRTYTKQILPQMEQSIEISMLQKQFQEIKSEELKQDLIRAYTRRRIKDLANQFSKLDDYKKQEDSMRHHDLPELNVYSFVPIGDHDFEDVGKYTMFPATDIQKYFLNNQMFGEYFEVEFYRTRKFGVMISEEIGNSRNSQQTLKLTSTYNEKTNQNNLHNYQFSQIQTNLSSSSQKSIHYKNSYLVKIEQSQNIFFNQQNQNLQNKL